jgi:hypothetical protein
VTPLLCNYAKVISQRLTPIRHVVFALLMLAKPTPTAFPQTERIGGLALAPSLVVTTNRLVKPTRKYPIIALGAFS